MNWLEQHIYGIVSRNPVIKLFIRNIYQGCFDLLPKPKEFFYGNIDYREGFFFGFHDVTPISKDDNKCLANKLCFDLRMPQKGEGLEIGYFDIEGEKFGQFHSLGFSYAWNYHKGCRLQWLDSENVIFNTADKNVTKSKSINIKTRQEKSYDWPIDTASHNSQLATSFSYERLERCMPGYGYPYQDESFLDTDAPDETGLFVVNLQTNTRQLIVPLSKLVPLAGEKYANDYLHFVTHTEFSMDDRYISFLYRCIPRHDNYLKRHTMMVVYDREEDRLITLPTQISGSHYVWNHRNQIIASVTLNGKPCHTLYDINDVDNYQIIAGDKLNSDGHQSFVNDRGFVTDTYPDRRRMAKIVRADTITHEVRKLICVYSPKTFQTTDFKRHIACDLHPRVSESGRYLCFDSPRTGKRALYIMAL